MNTATDLPHLPIADPPDSTDDAPPINDQIDHPCESGFLPADPFKRPGVGIEKREQAKNYAAMYDSYVPRPGWTIADQYDLISNYQSWLLSNWKRG